MEEKGSGPLGFLAPPEYHVCFESASALWVMCTTRELNEWRVRKPGVAACSPVLRQLRKQKAGIFSPARYDYCLWKDITQKTYQLFQVPKRRRSAPPTPTRVNPNNGTTPGSVVVIVRLSTPMVAGQSTNSSFLTLLTFPDQTPIYCADFSVPDLLLGEWILLPFGPGFAGLTPSWVNAGGVVVLPLTPKVKSGG
jgi:hypothetical protein